MKKIIITFLLIAISFSVALKGRSATKENPTPTNSSETKKVSVQAAQDSHALKEEFSFPGLAIGDQEAIVTAKVAGTIKNLNFDLGKMVSANQLLVKVDDSGSHLSSGKNNLQSGTVLQLELAVRQAKESLELAENNYDINNSFANRSARDIAKRQYESARVALASALDSFTIVSPISGTVIEKNVSLGDSVAVGQKIAVISKTGLKKIRFFVSEEQLVYFTNGTSLTVINATEERISAKVTNIYPEADEATRKFAIEAVPEKTDSLNLGGIVTVTLETALHPQNPTSLILPLSAITIGQNENYIFISEESKAKKLNVTLEKISGEAAELSGNIPENAQIIIEGNKLLQEGDTIELK